MARLEFQYVENNGDSVFSVAITVMRTLEMLSHVLRFVSSILRKPDCRQEEIKFRFPVFGSDFNLLLTRLKHRRNQSIPVYMCALFASAA
jgi:hypothetical protein